MAFTPDGTRAVTTDKDGKFTLRGLSKAKAYILVADPDEGTEHLHRFAYVEDSTAFEPIQTGITLPRGVVVTGQVTDVATRIGVARSTAGTMSARWRLFRRRRRPPGREPMRRCTGRRTRCTGSAGVRRR